MAYRGIAGIRGLDFIQRKGDHELITIRKRPFQWQDEETRDQPRVADRPEEERELQELWSVL